MINKPKFLIQITWRLGPAIQCLYVVREAHGNEEILTGGRFRRFYWTQTELNIICKNKMHVLSINILFVRRCLFRFKLLTWIPFSGSPLAGVRSDALWCSFVYGIFCMFLQNSTFLVQVLKVLSSLKNILTLLFFCAQFF